MTDTVSTAASTGPARAAEKRGCLFSIFIRRGLKWLGILLVTLIVLGVAYQTIATELDKGKYTPRGQFFTVNGHQMHLVCMGEGHPTVILQAGATAESLWWYWLQKQLAEYTRACAYDRAGLGWSEPASGPRDPLTIVDELHTLLQEAGVNGPYIMAGHSFGAVWTRIYASRYPQDVSGIVLVDSTMLPRQNDYPQWKTFNGAIQVVLWAMTRTGLLRLILPSQFQSVGLPPDIVQELSARQSHNQTFDTTYAETVGAMPALIEAAAPAEHLGDLEMIVLWASRSDTARDQLTVFRQEIATYSSSSVTRMIEGADHGSILGNERYAQQVTDAILNVIEAAQTGQPLKQQVPHLLP